LQRVWRDTVSLNLSFNREARKGCWFIVSVVDPEHNTENKKEAELKQDNQAAANKSAACIGLGTGAEIALRK